MAYVDLLAMLQRFQLRMDRTYPVIGPPPPRPPEPTDEARELVSAKVAAFGSDEVKKLLKPLG
jgi:hypothetical protein